MNKNTLQITFGAMILAIFAMLLLLNRQTGGIFESLFIYILPIPMVIYSAKFSWKSGLMVFIGMCAFSLFFGTLTSIFYAVTSALLGLVLGTFIYKKVDPTVTIIVTMGIAGTLSVISNIALASVFGYNVAEDIAIIQSSMTEAFEKANIDINSGSYALIFSDNSMLQLYIISMFMAGLVDGFIVYKLSQLILKRLRYPLQKSLPISQLYPPKWSGLLAMAAYVYGSSTFLNPNVTQAASSFGQTLWIVGYLYLVLFGIIAATLFMMYKLRFNKILITFLCVLFTFTFPQFLMIAGLWYITFGLHDRLIEMAKAE